MLKCALLFHLIDSFTKIFEMSLNRLKESENRIGAGCAFLCSKGQLSLAFSGCFQLFGEICMLSRALLFHQAHAFLHFFEFGSDGNESLDNACCLLGVGGSDNVVTFGCFLKLLGEFPVLLGTLSLHGVNSIMHLLKLLANGGKNLQNFGILFRTRLSFRKLDLQLLCPSLCRSCLRLELDEASCSSFRILETAS